MTNNPSMGKTESQRNTFEDYGLAARPTTQGKGACVHTRVQTHHVAQQVKRAQPPSHVQRAKAD